MNSLAAAAAAAMPILESFLRRSAVGLAKPGFLCSPPTALPSFASVRSCCVALQHAAALEIAAPTCARSCRREFGHATLATQPVRSLVAGRPFTSGGTRNAHADRYCSIRTMSSLPLPQPATDPGPKQRIPAKALLTDDEHPCGEGKLEWPFNAKAFYVGE